MIITIIHNNNDNNSTTNNSNNLISNDSQHSKVQVAFTIMNCGYKCRAYNR